MKKRKKRRLFPHNFLKNTAKFLRGFHRCLKLFLSVSFKILLLSFILLAVFLNLHLVFFPENEKIDRAKKEVLSSPFNPAAHLNLAKAYLELGDLKAAEEEFSLAKSLTSSDSPNLNNMEAALNQAKEEPKMIRQEISFWEEVIQKKADYRDAYFRLAVLNYQIGQKEEAKRYLERTLELDPDFEPAQKLQKSLN